jgi:hypothetical protein
MPTYYVLLEEWLYPTESGREPVEVTFDYLEAAMAHARDMAEKEMSNFADITKVDCRIPDRCASGNGDSGSYILTCMNGLDAWYYAVRVFKITPKG